MTLQAHIEAIKKLIAAMVMILVVASIVIFAWHFVMPTEWRWLSDDQMRHVRDVIMLYGAYCVFRVTLEFLGHKSQKS